MAIEIKIPSPGESISEVEIATWFVQNGDYVEKDQEVGEVESEKATLPLIAEDSGEITILRQAGETVAVGTIVGTIDPSKKGKKPAQTKAAKKTPETEAENREKEPSKAVAAESKVAVDPPVVSPETIKAKTTPLARKLMEDNDLDIEAVLQGLKKISTREVNLVLHSAQNKPLPDIKRTQTSREETREKMSNLRKKLSQRLVSVKNETAMLTTFNEADMSEIMTLRKRYQDKFVEKYGVKLGFMSFFTKAVTEALLAMPQVNSRIEEDEIITPGYCDIGIAVQTDKGLMVPVLRNTETLSLANIEKQIIEIAGKARKNRISIEEMTGGTFTITNGGIFGSMLSTPLINPPQAAILGMHNILERPVAVNGKVEIRPMMYLALSYDHRIIDGRDSVSFLVKVKELIENPTKMLFSGNDPETMLLGL